MPRKEETPEERAERKRRERESETPEQRAERKAKEAERDSRHRKEETPEERAARKAKEAERDGGRRKEETPEERAERKRREKEGETPEQRAERKAKEAERDSRHRKEETPEERAERKRREREAETPEQRAERKAKEAERDSRSKKEETPEERAERKRREREAEARKALERDEKDRREVVHKPLPQTLQKQNEHHHQAAVVAKPEPVVQARNPKLPPQSAKPAAAEEEYDDDDFVDGFEVEQMLEAQKAVIAENAAFKRQPAGNVAGGGGGAAASANRSMSPQPAAAVVGHSRFGADDLQRQKYRAQFERDLARATALRRLVDLDDVSAVIADIPPLSEYDMYIRNFGGTGRKQMGNQAPPLEDKVDVEVQAERVAVKSKSGQCPEDLGLFPEKAATISSGDPSDDGPNSNGSKKGPMSVDATLMSSFLARVFPVMRTLLDEAHFGHGTSIKQSTVPFSSTYTTFQTKETIGRPVQRIAFNASAVQYVLCLHAPKKHRSTREDNRLPADRCDGLGVVWNVNDPTLPDKLLTHSCALTAACFSPTRPHLVYAGCSDGAVCIWDLRELDSAHATDERISTVTLRVPSFTTEWQLDNHASPIVQMCVAGYNAVLGSRRDENDQLVTLDRNGAIYFWMVNDGSGGATTTTAAGSSSPSRWGGGGAAGSSVAGQSSDQENGQLMASRVRCFRAATMTIGRPMRSAEYAAMQPSAATHKFGNSCDIDFCPADASRFVVAAGATIHHMSRFSSITAPSVYAPHSQFFGEAASAPSACSFSSLDSRILISGYNDGTVRVYLKDEGHPQLSIPVSTVPIRQVRTSATIKLISFALDENGTFFILDHGIEEKEVPVVQGGVGTSETGRCLCFGVPPEDKVSNQLMFGFEDGSTQLHILNDKWLAPPASRSEKWL